MQKYDAILANVLKKLSDIINTIFIDKVLTCG